MKNTKIIIMMTALPVAIYAYVGPGAGVSFIGALWAVISAILLAIGGLLVWPIRALLRRIKHKKQLSEKTEIE